MARNRSAVSFLAAQHPRARQPPCNLARRASTAACRRVARDTQGKKDHRGGTVGAAGAMNPLVSILINNFNYAKYLPQAIDSALSQTYQPIEVIVVDDGSTDDSQRILSRYEPQVVPILKKNGGQASAFNAGVARSAG